MCRMLLIIICVILCNKEYCQAQTVISNSAEHISQRAFVGLDRDMPVDGSSLFAVQLEGIPRGSWPPASFEDIFEGLLMVTPRWQVVAMRTGKGDYECSANVNGVEYSTILLAWIEVEWGLGNPSSPTTTLFESIGISNEDMMIQAIHSGFCAFLRDGEEAGLAMINSFALPRNQQ